MQPSRLGAEITLDLTLILHLSPPHFTWHVTLIEPITSAELTSATPAIDYAASYACNGSPIFSA